MGKLATLLRAFVVMVCCVATWISVRHARADYAGSPGSATALERGLQIEPENIELAVWDALLMSYKDDPSPEVDKQLLHALRMNPMSSEVLIALGLRAERQGDNAQAERYLLQATEVDHTFKPASAFANFCVRSGQPDKFWPMARRCLNLDPLNLDPRPIFDLAWNLTDDAAKIQAILPPGGPRWIDYLGYLMDTKRPDAAATVWPRALAAFDASRPGNVEALARYCGFMAESQKTASAVRAWNQLVDHQIIQSGLLDPAAGLSVADPNFSFPGGTGLFSWQVNKAEGLFVNGGASAVRIELDGNEPEPLTLLSTTAAVLPGRAYRLVWNYDASQLGLPRDQGFDIRIVQQPGNLLSQCQPFLSVAETGACSFTSGEHSQVRIELVYKRALGTTRARGMLMISNIHLEFDHPGAARAN